MFKKTKRRIVFAVVFSLLILMAVTLSTIYLSNRYAIRRENEKMLETYAERYFMQEAQHYGPEGRDGFDDNGDVPDKPPLDRGEGRFEKDEPRFQLSTFYSFAFSDTGKVIDSDCGNKELYSENELLEKATEILKSGKTSGVKGNLSYLVEKRDGYTLVAMIDGTISESNQTTLIRQMLIIGTAAMVVLAVVSVFIAKIIVRPLEENDKRQKRFVSDAGHELKTPIAVISANSELLRREAGDSEWLDNIDYENERMSDLVKQLLILSKAESGDLPKEIIDFSKLTDGEVLPFESLAFEKNVRIESDTEPEIKIEGNANQLRQLVSILLDNAISHGTGKTVALNLRCDKHSAILSVTNQANDIGQEDPERLFDRFYRGDESRSENASHYGLGLSIAKAIVRAHGGAIKADYKNCEVTFTVTIPLKSK